MAPIHIEGIDVQFPFTPYSTQVDFMNAVIKALQEKKNALLESPTGTGKTLSLLCSTLAWLETAKARLQFQRLAGMDQEAIAALDEDLLSSTGNVESGLQVPRIIYATRTHSQISQVMGELKRTRYNHVKVAVLGSRDQLCIHPSVSKMRGNAAKQQACRTHVKSRSCMFYNNTERRDLNSMTGEQPILDIEDLMKAGLKQKVCPYYLTRKIAKLEADVIFLPYNYLIDPMIRQKHGIDLSGCVIVFDEAHNLPQLAEEAASVEIRTSDINSAILALDRVLDLILNEMTQPQPFAEQGEGSEDRANLELLTAENVAKVKAVLLGLDNKINQLRLVKGSFGDEQSYTADSAELLTLLSQCGISQECFVQIHDICEAASTFLSNPTQLETSLGTMSTSSQHTGGIIAFNEFIKIVFESEMGNQSNYQSNGKSNKSSQCFKLHVKTSSTKFKGDRTLCYWCFSPHLALKQLKDQGVRTIILSSGTLKPLNSFKAELGIPFDVMFSAAHVIRQNQISVNVCKMGISGKNLNSSYRNRENPDYLTSLGLSILQIIKFTVGGTLVFFPSYTTLKLATEHWNNKTSIMSDMQRSKTVIIEPRDKEEFVTAMTDFYNSVDEPSSGGAVFMAVCRGKVSEGLDFKDRYGRSVIITGIPFAPAYDARIVMKKQYLNKRLSSDKNGLTGDLWYSQQASRAVNQAVGRVIRHKYDYGAIFFLDERFAQGRMRQELPQWLSQAVVVHDTFQTVIKNSRQFFSQTPSFIEVRKREDGYTESTGADNNTHPSNSSHTASHHKENITPSQTKKRERLQPEVTIRERKKIKINDKIDIFSTQRSLDEMMVVQSSPHSSTESPSNSTSLHNIEASLHNVETSLHNVETSLHSVKKSSGASCSKTERIALVQTFMKTMKVKLPLDDYINFKTVMKNHLKDNSAELNECFKLLEKHNLKHMKLDLLNIIGRSASDNPTHPGETRPDQSAKPTKDDKRDNVRQFMQEVKTALKLDDYITFKNNLKNYMTSDSLAMFMECVRILEKTKQHRLSQYLKTGLLKENLKAQFNELHKHTVTID